MRGRRPVLTQLEPVSWSQLAADGVFVLDTSSLLVLWLGRAANLVDKIFGAKVTLLTFSESFTTGEFRYKLIDCSYLENDEKI